jgi:pyruvate-ferredoxin/flavodoxin oxidoreductase
MEFKSADVKGSKYALQVAPDDCTGCSLCVAICPAESKTEKGKRAINRVDALPLKEKERRNWDFFLSIPDPDRTKVKLDVKGTQFLEPLFEFSGACTGCGETPYLKLLTQLYGDRAVIANATGCSSIFGGNLPTTPYTQNRDGRGPAWANSLFEDNAEFGFGMRLAIDKQAEHARELLAKLGSAVGDGLVKELLAADQTDEAGIEKQRARVKLLKEKLQGVKSHEALRLKDVADYLVRKSVWIVGGDGWAYDIGYGGLDHVLSMHRDVNVLVLDTEVYSNTGGQQSKATPTGASAKFASAGKESPKKDIGMMAMAYGHVYVARVAFGAKDVQTLKAFQEAESYPGPSLIIAYSHCIAHGYDMAYGAEQQKLAVDSGVWPLYRFDPRRTALGQPPLALDSGEPKIPAQHYMRNETRFRMVEKLDPVRYKKLLASAERQAKQRVAVYKQLSALTVPRITDAELSPKPQLEAPPKPQPEAPAKPQPEPVATKH